METLTRQFKSLPTHKTKSTQTHMWPCSKKILEQKNWFLQTDPTLVDWDSIEAAMAGMTITQKCWTSKFITGFCPTGKRSCKPDKENWQLAPGVATN